MGITQRYTFPKTMRLSSKKEIDALFVNGKAFTLGPFRVFYLIQAAMGDNPSCRVVISVPKKHHKRAVVRNLIRRRTRESYRLYYPSLLARTVKSSHASLSFLCLYLPHEILTYRDIESKMQALLERLSQILEKSGHFSIPAAD
ncbi:MAG: ribonuclease P protein component [Bacteroidales bacterium]|jgi:ribonuclease P protein component|nr:ribonuclease P protein component [Bacteroidales bacterium]MDD4257155.1 ribonuclease P protein component [Bacteroidales bacterium]MDD4654305.1 ribonuclease P protein component [Bacteroidales bacterium]MDD4828126.1 ribonuclease P protein component [Bacteroidales bacterium]HNY23403.1 ribonuclease P protein component [Bacteroidales bacterium]